MTWTTTWRAGIRERFERLLGGIGTEASKLVEEGLHALPAPLPGLGPHCVVIMVRGVDLDCCVNPVSQTVEIRGVQLDEQS